MSTKGKKRSAKARKINVNGKSVKKISKEQAMKDELKKATEQEVTSISMPVQIMKKTRNGYTIVKEERQFGLIKENRPIKKSDVIGFMQIIRNNKYDEAQAIVTVEAEEISGKYNMVDLQGKRIPTNKLKGYLIVLDGQHRISAFSKLNAIKEEKDRIAVPNIHIKSGLKNIREYLADINMVGHHWNMGDKVCVSAIATNNKTLRKINELIKSGMNASTASTICTGKRLSAKQIKNILVKGDTSTLFKEKETRTEKEMLEFADKFVTTAMSVTDMTPKILATRHFIDGFNSFVITKKEKKAFEALSNLTIEDFKGVHDSNDFVMNLEKALSA